MGVFVPCSLPGDHGLMYSSIHGHRSYPVSLSWYSNLRLSLSSSVWIVFILYLFFKYLFGYFGSQLPHVRSSLRRTGSLLHGLLSSCGVGSREFRLSSDGVQA